MKQLLIVLSAGFVYFCIITTPMLAQTEWTKYANNPVLDVGPPGSFDGIIFFHSIFLDDTTYKMYYTGFPGNFGLATSTDGLNWEKSLFNPILTENEPGFEGLGVLPYVLKHEGIYKMWFIARDADGVRIHIRYATSVDGIVWTPHPSIPAVLEPGAEGEWDDTIVNVGTVIIENDSTYRMWYAARNSAPAGHQIGHASSTDGVNWSKHPNNPILTLGANGEWDDDFILFPGVIYDGNIYHMFYNGSSGSSERLGYATSPDGIAWTKDPSNPVLPLGEAGSWDEAAAVMGRAMLDGQTFKLWYAGKDASGIWRIGHATAPLIVGIEDDRNAALPAEFSLAQNYPNPFNPTTTITFNLPKSDFVNLRIYNASGQLLKSLVNEQKSAGTHSVQWDASMLSSGIYFYRIRAGEYSAVHKALLLK